MKKFSALFLFTFIIIKTFCQSAFIEDVYLKPPHITNEIIKTESKDFKPDYRGIVELGYLLKINDKSWDRLKFNLICSYEFNPYFSLGFGTGLRYYLTTNRVLIPLLADVRINFSKEDFSPYLSLLFGYSFAPKSNFSGYGFLVNPSFGVRFKISTNAFMNFGISYEFQNMNYYTPYYSYIKRDNQGLGVHLGYSF